MSTQAPKDPIHDFESVVYKLVGLFSTLVIVGDSFVNKVSKVRWEVKAGLVGALIALGVWVYYSRKNQGGDSDDSQHG
jgi:hypothetical protein